MTLITPRITVCYYSAQFLTNSLRYSTTELTEYSIPELVIAVALFPVPDIVAVTIWGIAIGMCGGTAWLNAWLFRSIVRLNDLKSSKARLARAIIERV